MSPSEPDRRSTISELARSISGDIVRAVETYRVDDIPDDALGQLFASVVRAFAAKALDGNPPRPFNRDLGVTATDVMIGCTAMLEAVDLKVYELGLWESWDRVGHKRREGADSETQAMKQET